MSAVYRSAFTPLEQPDALVIHCSDPRFQKHFHEFLRTHLGLDTYGLLAVPGGTQFLTMVDYLPKFSWAGWRWTKFLFDLQKVTRVILIAHDDCRWYQDLRFGFRPRPMREHQIEDLQAVAREIRTRFAGVRPELYYAKMDAGQVTFEAL